MAMMKLLFDHCEFRCPHQQRGCDFRYSGGDRSVSLSHLRECTNGFSDGASSDVASFSSSAQHSYISNDDQAITALIDMNLENQIQQRPLNFSYFNREMNQRQCILFKVNAMQKRMKPSILSRAAIKQRGILQCECGYYENLHLEPHVDFPKNPTITAKIYPAQRRLFQTKTYAESGEHS